MNLTETGTVIRIDGENATVAITRKSACGESCASCKAGCVSADREIIAKNICGAAVGDRVSISMESQRVLGAAFAVYLLPLLLAIAGYALGANVFDGERAGILIGAIFMLATFFGLHLHDKRVKFIPKIIEILSSENK